MSVPKNYNNRDMLTGMLWTSYLIGCQHGTSSFPIMKINSLQVAKMLELREDALFLINELERDLAAAR